MHALPEQSSRPASPRMRTSPRQVSLFMHTMWQVLALHSIPSHAPTATVQFTVQELASPQSILLQALAVAQVTVHGRPGGQTTPVHGALVVQATSHVPLLQVLPVPVHSAGHPASIEAGCRRIRSRPRRMQKVRARTGRKVELCPTLIPL